jgi:hypothetical protein
MGRFMARTTAIHVSPPSGRDTRGCRYQRTQREDSGSKPVRTPSRQSFGTTRRSTAVCCVANRSRCSHFGSPLKPGRPVLTLGVSRRRRISGLCSCRRLTERGACSNAMKGTRQAHSRATRGLRELPDSMIYWLAISRKPLLVFGYVCSLKTGARTPRPVSPASPSGGAPCAATAATPAYNRHPPATANSATTLT